ncbi:hypothetical protein R1sor_022746 [Riccia sorocarpa]|uniref:Hexosyltransferase n=1 Tax=Riccia sorocarpa TaxID=122646 RepID=A0ABD3GNW8_9MARC
MIELDPAVRPRKSQAIQLPTVVFLAVSIALGSMMTMGFLLYASVVSSPTLVDYLFPEHHFCPGQYSMDMLPGEQDPAAEIHLSQKQQLQALEQPTLNSNLTSNLTSSFMAKDRKLEDGDPPSVSILIGILTTAKKTERRQLLRTAYRVQSTQLADVEVKFVMGKLEDEEDKVLVSMESLVYGDILELECAENMNHGKTFTFFSTVSEMARIGRARSYSYVMKTDDDSYVRVDNLAKRLLSLSRTDLYYGYILPCENHDPYAWYMAGMGYLISWDLVDWIRESPLVRNNTDGTEDKLVGEWFNEGGKAKNRVNDKPLFYDHPAFGGNCAHELIPESILVHQVKTAERWADVLKFFEADLLNISLPIRVLLQVSSAPEVRNLSIPAASTGKGGSHCSIARYTYNQRSKTWATSVSEDQYNHFFLV